MGFANRPFPIAKELMTAEEYEAVQGYILNGAEWRKFL